MGVLISEYQMLEASIYNYIPFMTPRQVGVNAWQVGIFVPEIISRFNILPARLIKLNPITASYIPTLRAPKYKFSLLSKCK